MDIDVPPLLSPHRIAQVAAEEAIPDDLRNEGVLTVERRWVTVSLR